MHYCPVPASVFSFSCSFFFFFFYLPPGGWLQLFSLPIKFSHETGQYYYFTVILFLIGWFSTFILIYNFITLFPLLSTQEFHQFAPTKVRLYGYRLPLSSADPDHMGAELELSLMICVPPIRPTRPLRPEPWNPDNNHSYQWPRGRGKMIGLSETSR